MSKRRSIIYIIILFCGALKAQHYQFSQFYASPTYLNPAFTGANVCGRFSLNYRKQWSGIPGSFTTYQASLDHNLAKYKSGIGLQFFSDNAGLANLKTQQINLLYAYETRVSKKLMARAGFAAGFVSRSIDLSALTFGDQLARGNAATSVEGFTSSRANYFDVSTGLLVFSKSTWMGFTATHINRPNQSLMNELTPLPPEIRLHGGYKFVIDESDVAAKLGHQNSVTFCFNYKKQRRFNQIDAGIYYARHIAVLGIWYRGIPLFKPEAYYSNSDAIILLAGISIGKYKMGYSYDYTISQLGINNSRGSHELTLAAQLCNQRKTKKKRNVLISCPKF